MVSIIKKFYNAHDRILPEIFSSDFHSLTTTSRTNPHVAQRIGALHRSGSSEIRREAGSAIRNPERSPAVYAQSRGRGDRHYPRRKTDRVADRLCLLKETGLIFQLENDPRFLTGINQARNALCRVALCVLRFTDCAK